MRSIRIGRGAALALLAAALAPAAAQAQAPLAVEYDAFVAGFPAVTFDFRIHLDDTTYRVTGGARTNGLADVLMHYRLRTESDGRVLGSGLMPALHETRSDGRWRLRTTHLVFDGNGVHAEVTPPVDRPLEASLLTGSLDPLTAVLAAGRRLAAQGRCDQRVKVFDGRRRFDLDFADAGDEELQPTFGIFGGIARRCVLHLRKITGFEEENKKPGTPAEVWFASVATGTAPIPVRLDFNSQWGSATIRLTSVKPAEASPPPPATR